jgi:hypothetical protein
MENSIKMNERLHDMMMEATKDMPECYYVPGEYFEKFAELIVQECANQCTTEGPFVAEVVWGKQFHKKIKQHFGVM